MGRLIDADADVGNPCPTAWLGTGRAAAFSAAFSAAHSMSHFAKFVSAVPPSFVTIAIG